MSDAAITPRPPRSCDGCALCCKLGEIPDVKAYNAWCVHCSTHAGCDIYETRPAPCRSFFCHYLRSDIGEHWRPAACGMVIATHTEPLRMSVLVDPERAGIWQSTPYIEELVHWSTQGSVTVMVGTHAFAVYPERVEDLGIVDDNSIVEITEYETTQGIVRRARCAPKGAPLP